MNYTKRLFQYDKEELMQKSIEMLYEQTLKYLELDSLTYNVLDVGCGSEGFGKYLLSYGIAFRYTGIDISDVNLTKAKRKYGHLYKYKKMDARKMSFKNNSFDRIVCSELLEHFDACNFSLILQQIERVMKPEGIAVITVPNLYYLWGYLPWSLWPFRRRMPLSTLIEGIKEGGADENHPEFKPHYRFRPKDFKWFIELGGQLEVEKITTTYWFNNRYLGHIPKFIQRWLHRHLRGWLLGSQMVIKCRKKKSV